jgi:hypothetical protein
LFPLGAGCQNLLPHPQLQLNGSQEWLARVGRTASGLQWQPVLSSLPFRYSCVSSLSSYLFSTTF